MNILNCDICGTLFPETEEKCPTCGYSRAFVEDMPEPSGTPAVREKVRGGRFSKKNVSRRLKLLEELAAAGEAKNQNGAAAVEALVAEMESPVQAPREEPAGAASEPALAPEPEKAEVPAGVQCEAEEEQAVPVWTDLIQEREEPAEAGEPAAAAEPEEEQQAEEMPAVPVEVPDEPVIGEADQASGYEEEQARPEADAQTAEAREAERKKAVLKAYRRDVRLNLLLFTSIVVFLLSLGYMVVNYDLSDIQDMIESVVAAGDAPADASGDMPAAQAGGETDVVLLAAEDCQDEAYIICYST